MEQLIKDFTSTYWWLILLIGLIVGIIGTFMADGIKKLWGLVSSRQRERNARLKERNLISVEYLVRYPSEVADYQFRASQSSHAATRSLVITFALFIIAKPSETTEPYLSIFVAVLALLPMYAFTRFMSESERYDKIVLMTRK